jgi:hypothetical protein
MKNATEWMSLNDESWAYDRYGTWLYVEPDAVLVHPEQGLEALTASLTESLAGRHKVVYEGTDQADSRRVRLHIDGVVREFPFNDDGSNVHRALAEVIDALQADTVFFMNRDDMYSHMHCVLPLPRAEAETMQAQFPEQVQKRLMALKPGQDLWQWVVLPEEEDDTAPIAVSLASISSGKSANPTASSVVRKDPWWKLW